MNKKLLFSIASLLLSAVPALCADKQAIQAAEQSVHLGEALPIYSVFPFVGILLSIALLPLLAPRFWHHHFGKVSAFWALLFAVPFLFTYGHPALHEILHIYLIDYIPFIILLWSLFTVAGGILLEGSLKGKPITNAVMLLIGTIIASWAGTTGASMLMIRPVLRANAGRKSKIHVIIFFIFLISNIGGALTPLGDPPLFLGFLHGVPFFWTFSLIPETAFVALLVLAIFFLIDTVLYNRDAKAGHIQEDQGERIPLRVRGLYNLIFLAGIVGGVLMSGIVHLGEITVFGVLMEKQNILRDLILIVMGLLSLKLTRKEIRKNNEFSWGPILEVAYLFAGIFMCILPALAMLRAGANGHLDFIINAVKEPWHYFWITGVLSSFLDNAPTYLTFFNTALGSLQLTEAQIAEALRYSHDALIQHGFAEDLVQKMETFSPYLKAISTGAVFMGANTYIGNAPNFMVRSIAEEQGIRMPSFFGYMAWSVGILIPIFILTTFIFF
jgi:Na+/H+ antiporter NhaD/arsenite permease-like protein